jgi:hypothetical protein
VALKFFFDECVDEDIALALRAHQIDVLTTTTLGRKGMTDEEHLEFALREGRVIYTIDQDFLILAHQYLEQNSPFAGFVYHKPGQKTKREIIDFLLLMNAVYEPEDMRNRVEFI